ncbi:glycosyltransferase [Inhella proteolytica]|uniref:Glycosyltransferase n=1 Tax=Inhella proteolytica TaxID=2795029 RepID=A0A931J2H2_9BURK|nr:glycosyltransferase [Inhella proteolytica]MBH9576508.1 glycosyltransferase [Inhella proteolytica]
MNKLLMVAYHFPPLAGSSGIQRTLRFVQQLPQFGWQPQVLTAHPRAYERCDVSLLADVPADVPVLRAQAWDTARHLALGGRYLGAWARPDRWASWRFDAVRQGMAWIRRERPRAIWSTYPIATAQRIGAELAQRSGLPWIADFRDPMAQDGYPADPRTWESFRAIEALAFERAAACIFTTAGAERLYRERYPNTRARLLTIENGYDEDSFARAEAAPGERGPLIPGCLTLLHSGIVYPSERDPTQLMAALRQLLDQGRIRPGQLRLRFRAPVHGDLILQLATAQGVQEFVEVQPPLPYQQALAEMLRADALLVMQNSNCNDQVPAKLYEYLRARRPILALTDPAGDTAAVLRRSGVRTIAHLEDPAAIAAQTSVLLQGLHENPQALCADEAAVLSASRLARSRALAELLDSLPI